MANLKFHEQIVLDILVSGILPDATLEDIKSNPIISEYDVTGNGYLMSATTSWTDFSAMTSWTLICLT